MNKLKNLGVFVGLICLSVACGHEKHVELPPKYGMLCTPDSSQFVATTPGGIILYKNYFGYVPFNNYQDAINRAWRQYEYKPQPPDTGEWQECN